MRCPWALQHTHHHPMLRFRNVACRVGFNRLPFLRAIILFVFQLEISFVSFVNENPNEPVVPNLPGASDLEPELQTKRIDLGLPLFCPRVNFARFDVVVAQLIFDWHAFSTVEVD